MNRSGGPLVNCRVPVKGYEVVEVWALVLVVIERHRVIEVLFGHNGAVLRFDVDRRTSDNVVVLCALAAVLEDDPVVAEEALEKHLAEAAHEICFAGPV